MRVFFALPIDGKTRLGIDQWRSQSFPPFKGIVPAANYHITLAFLGALPAVRLEDLCQKVDSLLDKHGLEKAPFQPGTLQINQTGYWSKPGILWVGPDHWSSSLGRLAVKLSNICCQFGAKKDKQAYQPHITLVRKCQSPHKPVIEPDFTLHFDRVTLFETKPTKRGVGYHPVQEWALTEREQINDGTVVRGRSRRIATRS